jgi:alpha-L-arabinofuranosidase
MTSPTGLLKQPTFFPFQLFATFMRGKNLSIYVESPKYEGTLGSDRPWVKDVCADSFGWVDATAALDGDVLNVAIINRHAQETFEVELNLAAPRTVVGEMEVHELHHENILAVNTWEDSQNVVPTKSTAPFKGTYTAKAGSFSLLRLTLSK